MAEANQGAVWRRGARLALYVLVGFVVGSLLLGANKGNPFVDNLLYGLWTGAIAGAVTALAYGLLRR
jgi:hypothetical protein